MKLGFALAIPKRTSLTLAALVTLVLMGTLLSDTPGSQPKPTPPRPDSRPSAARLR